MKRTIRSVPQGFTLIELLVVISIIAILAGIALPAFNGVVERGQQTKALSNGKQIYLGLKMFAGDNDGAFPSVPKAADGSEGTGDIADANAAFRWLVPDYIQSEAIFWLAKSGWCNKKAPDENTASGSALAGGENHWAYVRKLSDTSKPALPIIADGFSSTVGEYSEDETAPGGVWKAKAAIVVRVDGSGKVERIKPSDNKKVVGPIGGAAEGDIFAVATNWLVTGQTPVNPLAATSGS